MSTSTSSRAAGGFGGALVVSLVAVAVVLGGWTGVLSQAYAPPSGSIESASGAEPTRQPVVDGALGDIGAPACHHEVGHGHLLFSAGTAVTYRLTGGVGEPGRRPLDGDDRPTSSGRGQTWMSPAC